MCFLPHLLPCGRRVGSHFSLVGTGTFDFGLGMLLVLCAVCLVPCIMVPNDYVLCEWPVWVA